LIAAGQTAATRPRTKTPQRHCRFFNHETESTHRPVLRAPLLTEIDPIRGSALLRQHRFDLLITKPRAAEGLHLGIHSRTFSLNTAATVVADAADDVGEIEAAAFDAGVVVNPSEPDQMRAVIASTTEERLLRANLSTHS
jgi:hypothetical protein